MTVEEFVKGEVERWVAYAKSCPASPWVGVGIPPHGPHHGIQGRWRTDPGAVMAQVFVPRFVEEFAVRQAASCGAR